MTALEPTPARRAVAERAAAGDWTFGPAGPVDIETDPVLAELVGAGLVQPYYVSAAQQVAGREDRYVLTEAGREWLALAMPGPRQADPCTPPGHAPTRGRQELHGSKEGAP